MLCRCVGETPSGDSTRGRRSPNMVNMKLGLKRARSTFVASGKYDIKNVPL